MTFICILFWCCSALKRSIQERKIRNVVNGQFELRPRTDITDLQAVAPGDERVRISRAEVSIPYPPSARTSRRQDTIRTPHVRALHRSPQRQRSISRPPQVSMFPHHMNDPLVEILKKKIVFTRVTESREEHLCVPETL